MGGFLAPVVVAVQAAYSQPRGVTRLLGPLLSDRLGHRLRQSRRIISSINHHNLRITCLAHRLFGLTMA